jgi:MSHA biogenesis protein MshN
MSVINKMLRDLDKRKSTPKTAASLPDLSLRSGTASVSLGALPSRTAPKTRWGKVIAPGMVLILVLLVWEWQTGGLDQLERVLSGRSRAATVAPQPMAPPPEAFVASMPALAASAPEGAASAPQSAASAPSAVAPVPIAAPNAAAVAPIAKFEPALVLPPVKPVVPPAQTAAAPVVKAPAVEQVLTKGPAAASATAVAPAAATTPAPAAADPGQRQLQAARDAVAHAQALWNAGSKESALDLMQQAVASTERAATAAPSAAATQSLVLLAREQSRILLADGKAGAVWDLMVRLEPLFKGEPDMWALRANAAQRLGRHQDSVNAYMAALQSRPTEQRWLLGAAVSLAALGQTVSAAEMADKARTVGPISRDVQTYLRQMGVPVKD